MKTFLTIFVCVFVTLSVVSCKTAFRKNKSVALANKINEEETYQNQAKKDIAQFLTEIADGRMMDKKEGEEALKKGTAPDIKKYGQLMVKDQTKLLKELKKIAKAQGVILPLSISSKKQEGLEDLRKEEGPNFDKKFVKMIIIDHERDIKLFKKAGAYEDLAVRSFVAKYYPMIQSHLEKAETLKKNIQ